MEALAVEWINKGYPVSMVLRICRIPRSTYYYRLKHPERRKSSNGGRPIPGYSNNKDGQKVSDARIKGYLRRLLNGPHAASGYRKLTELLRREYNLVINKKKVYRLCKELGVLAPQRVVRNTAPRRIARNRVVMAPNQLWEIDVKYGYVAGKREHFFVANVLDVCDRQVVAHHRGKSCTTEDVLKTPQKALLKREVHVQPDKKLVIRTDNGPQFVSLKFQQFCEQNNIEHERIPNKTPNKNAHIEAFHSILEMECFRRHCFETFEEAFAEVDRFIRFTTMSVYMAVCLICRLENMQNWPRRDNSPFKKLRYDVNFLVFCEQVSKLRGLNRFCSYFRCVLKVFSKKQSSLVRQVRCIQSPINKNRKILC